MAKSWHKKHISTKWGVAIIGFLLISLGLFVFALNKSQDVRSNAAFDAGSGSTTCQKNADKPYQYCIRGIDSVYKQNYKGCDKYDTSGNSGQWRTCVKTANKTKEDGIKRCFDLRTSALNKCYYQQLPTCQSKGGSCQYSSCRTGQSYIRGVKCYSQSMICCRGGISLTPQQTINLYCKDASTGCNSDQKIADKDKIVGSAWKRASGGDTYCNSKNIGKPYCLVPAN